MCGSTTYRNLNSRCSYAPRDILGLLKDHAIQLNKLINPKENK